MAAGEISKVRVLESLYGEIGTGAHQMTLVGGDSQAFVGATTLLTVNPTTEDGFNFTWFVPRTVEMDVATITLTPSVRWTAITSPTADETVQWKMDYTYAAPTLEPNVASGTPTQFPDVRTLTTAISTLTGAEYRQHLVTVFPGFSFPARNMAPSFCVVGNVRISSVSTAANSLIGVLGVGCGYLSGPSGTSSILP
jgi:hypothetical protein